MNVPRRARSDARVGWTIDQWRTLIDDDLDENDREHASFREEIAAIKRYLMGILISTTTAAVLLAANLALGK